MNRVYIVKVWKVGLSFISNQDEMVEAREIVKVVEILVLIDEELEIRRWVVRLGEERGTVKEGGLSFINFHSLCNYNKFFFVVFIIVFFGHAQILFQWKRNNKKYK